MTKVVRCRWRSDGICPHPSRCRYGYECVARPVVLAHLRSAVAPRGPGRR